MSPLALWGGLECTLNRLGDTVSDQMALSGYDSRPDDLDAIMGLGVRKLRFPLLWETVERAPGVFDWAVADRRIGRLRESGVEPVLTLIHHGSGPLWTDLLDPGFPEGLARFAEAASRRYPWVRDWTPVNEPLTTARFSALYGHWYPHVRDEGACWIALLHQIEATVKAMARIRRAIPGARLIQTEDYGETFGTDACATQVAFENARRDLTWQLLAGRVDTDHPLRSRLDCHGLSARLDRLAAAPCPPDRLGLNHYVTSDRFLDHRLERYPVWTHGGNDVMAYADVEAVRVLADARDSWEQTLARAWRRHHTPIVISECHLGGPEADRSRWLTEAWTAAQQARARGIYVEAVTAWSLLGAYDWDSLLTERAGRYEAGVFDVSDGTRRETGVAATVRALASNDAAARPGGPGWWHRDDRLLYRDTERLRA